MKNSKKILVSLLAIGMLASCGGGSSTQSSSTTTSSNPPVSSESSQPTVKHTITVGETGGAMVTFDKETASAGEKVTITITNIPEDKVIDEVTTGIDGVDVMTTDNVTYYFIMPNIDVTISVILKDKVTTSYQLTIKNNADVTYHLLDSGMNELIGENGIFTLKANQPYYISVAGGNNNLLIYQEGYKDWPFASQDGIYSFTMPEDDYVIVIDQKEVGKVVLDFNAEAFEIAPYLVVGETMVDEANIAVGSTVKLEYSLNQGFIVTAVKINGSPIEASSDGLYSFVMPSGTITLTIETAEEGIEDDGKYLVTVNDEVQVFKVTFGTLKGSNNTFVPSKSFIQNYTELETGTTMYFCVELSKPYVGLYSLSEILIDGTKAEPAFEVTEGTETIQYYSFTITDHDIVITIKSEATLMPLNFTDTESTGATCVFTNSEGETVTSAPYNSRVTATFDNIPSGLSLYQLKVNGYNPTNPVYEGNSCTFTVPKAGTSGNVEVTAVFADTTTAYNLTYVAKAGATDLTTDTTVKFYTDVFGNPITTAHYGDVIYFNVSAPNGYIVKSVTIDSNDVSQTWGDDGKRYYTFTVENSNININIELEATSQTYSFSFDTTNWPSEYDLTVKINRNGWQFLNEDQYFGEAGETFSIDLWSTEKMLIALYANGEELSIGPDGVTYSFTLPAEDVVITAEWM